jgi:hypothetical protein
MIQKDRLILKGQLSELNDEAKDLIEIKRLYLKRLSKLTCNQFKDIDTQEIRNICDSIDKVSNDIKSNKQLQKDIQKRLKQWQYL